MANNVNYGCEIHRIKEFTHYDKDRFEKFYKLCKPLIRNLTKGIDYRRYNVSPDIIQSYFWDKFLYVYNKYQDDYEDERLKATLLSSLMTYKNKLLRNAYSKSSEFNQELVSLETLFDNNKELLDDSEEVLNKENKSLKFHEYMKERLSPDEYLLFVTQLDPPIFFQKRVEKAHGKLSIEHLIEFFELPKDKKSHDLISQMRKHIKAVLINAKDDFHF